MTKPCPKCERNAEPYPQHCTPDCIARQEGIAHEHFLCRFPHEGGPYRFAVKLQASERQTEPPRK